MIDEIERISKIKKERNIMKSGNDRFGGSSNFKKRNFWKLKDGDQIYRILPSLSELFPEDEKLKDQTRWSVFHSVHHGYTTSDGKKKSFLSSEVYNSKNKMVEVPDAAKDRIELLKGKLEEAKESGNEAIAEKLTTLVGPMVGKYNLDNNHYINVLDAQGNVGVLALRHTAKKALENEGKKCQADPLSASNGRYFVFNRTGTGRET